VLPESGPGPGYWPNEQTGVLVPVVHAYLRGDSLSDEEVAIMRAYLRQWIMSPVWAGKGIPELRASIDGINSRKDIKRWLNRAFDLGIDPL
jgi:hypothetical protein